LKTHYPAEFMSAVLSSDMDNTDKVVNLIDECRQMNLTIEPPNINVSGYRFTVNDQHHIVYGLGAIKGVGESAIEELINQRQEQGAYIGLYDLCKRVDLRKVNRRVLEALSRAGAFDLFDTNRALHLAELPTILKVAEQHGLMAEAGQNDLFGLAAHSESTVDNNEAYTSQIEAWSEQEKLANEKTTLGLYLTGHPIGQYEAEIRQFTHSTLKELKAKVEASKGRLEARVAGLVVEIRTRQTKQGKIMGFATLDDRTDRIEIAAFSETYEKYRSIFTRDNLLVAEGAVSLDDYTGNLRLTVESLYNIEEARETFAKGLQLNWNLNGHGIVPQELIGSLDTAIQPFRGGRCPVEITYNTKAAAANLILGDGWRVHPTDELVERLKRLPGMAAVEVKYR
ncbi:partial DNA polymerase III subunit alpha, partial [biofilm metagenome]